MDPSGAGACRDSSSPGSLEERLVLEPSSVSISSLLSALTGTKAPSGTPAGKAPSKPPPGRCTARGAFSPNPPPATACPTHVFACSLPSYPRRCYEGVTEGTANKLASDSCIIKHMHRYQRACAQTLSEHYDMWHTTEQKCHRDAA